MNISAVVLSDSSSILLMAALALSQQTSATFSWPRHVKHMACRTWSLYRDGSGYPPAMAACERGAKKMKIKSPLIFEILCSDI